MNKCNFIERSSAGNISIKTNELKTTHKTVSSEPTKFRLSEIIGIENYFYQ